MRPFAFLLFVVLTAYSASAKRSLSCADRQHTRKNSSAKITIASPLLEQYDVKYVKLDLSMSHLNTSVSGSTKTTAVVTGTANMSQYAFELNSNLSIDSVLFNNVKLSSSSIGTDVYAVTLPAALSPGIAFTAQVFYHGTPLNGNGVFFTHGVNHNLLGSGTNITFTLSDTYLAKDWWACKQSLTDKIDSADLWFTVPDSTKAGSNGRLQRVTPIGSNSSRYEWKTAYPIEYYLISVSIAPYDDHTQTVHFTGSSDSMPMQHYVLDTGTFYPQYKSAIDSTPGTIDYLSTIYGRYPFWKEKYGHCIAPPLGGGMEHQTMTTLGAYATPLIAHELGHQWWGDCVTYGSWRDIWLSEGWASYTEQLYVEHFRGVPAAMSYRTTVFNRVMAKANGAVYVDDTTNVSRIFDSRLTYDKGAAAAHMLRYLAPNDSVFFSGLRAYQQQYAFKTAITADFQKVMETAYGRPLDTFFNQWIYGEGFPIYTPTWNQHGNDVFVRLDQFTSAPASVAAFALPVVLKLRSATVDTLVKVYFNSASRLYSFKWNNVVTDVVVDPNNDIVNRADPAVYDPQLSVGFNTPKNIRVYPNPTEDSWQISSIPPRTSLTLRNVEGKVIWQVNEASEKLSIAAKNFPPGIYSLSIQNAANGLVTQLLQKR